MLADTHTITGSNSDTVTLTKIREGNFSSEFVGNMVTGGQRVKASIAHTLPGRGQSGESHLVKLQVEYLNVAGEYSHTAQAHCVIKTLDNVQSSDDSVDVFRLLVDFFSVNANAVRDGVVNGES